MNGGHLNTQSAIGVNNQLWILDTMEATLQGQVRCNRRNLSPMVIYVLKQQLELANSELFTRYNITHNEVLDPTNQLIRYNTRYVLIPIGFLYTQLPKEKAPSEIWPWMRWADVSSAYAGAFFRVQGGGSAPFGQVQSENTQRLVGIQSDGTNCNLLYNVRTVIGGWTPPEYTGGWDGDNVCLKFEMSGGEIRPRNMAIRVWKRIP